MAQPFEGIDLAGARSAWRGVLVVLLVAAVSALGAAPASAQSAEALIDEGIQLREQGRDGDALERFQRAFRESGTARALAQVALAEQALGRWVDANAHLTEALAMGGVWIETHRPTLENALATIRSRLGRLELVDGTPGARVRVNGEDAGTLPLEEVLYVPSGTVVIEVSAPGHVPLTRTVHIEPGVLARESVRQVAREPDSEPETQLERDAVAPSDASDDGALVGAIAASYAVAAAGTITLGIFGGLALAEADAIRTGCGADRSCTPDDLADGHAFATASDIGLGALVAGAAVGTILLLVHLDGDSETETRQATISPWVAPEGAGAIVQGVF